MEKKLDHNYILEDHKSKGFFSEIPHKVIYNGFKTISNNVNDKKRASENITFGFIGQLNQTKGIELILKSFSLLKKTNWVIYGLCRWRSPLDNVDHLLNLVNKKTCLLVAKKLELKKFITTGGSFKGLNRSDDKIISDGLEALLGAIFLDQGMHVVEKFILNIYFF